METDNGIVCSSLSEFIKEFPPMKLEWDNEIFTEEKVIFIIH